MSGLIPRSPAPGARLNWRRPAKATAPDPMFLSVVPAIPMDVDVDLAHHRRDGVTRALSHLRRGVEAGRTPAYRQERALIELRASVQRQALVAGIGHVHVGTRPCGVMCELLEVTR